MCNRPAQIPVDIQHITGSAMLLFTDKQGVVFDLFSASYKPTKVPLKDDIILISPVAFAACLNLDRRGR